MPTREELAKRRNHLEQVITELKESGTELTEKNLLAGMTQRLPEYNRNNLYNDRLNLKAEDTFVSDLSIYTYSSTIREMFEDIDLIRRETKKDFEDPSGFVRVNSKKIFLSTVELREKILSGKALDVSIELLGKEFRRLREDKEKLETELNKIKSLPANSSGMESGTD